MTNQPMVTKCMESPADAESTPKDGKPEVVCVESGTTIDAEHHWQSTVPMPEIDAVYHVQDLGITGFSEPGWQVSIALCEIPGLHSDGRQYRYPHGWFRRVEKPKAETSIEVFRQIDREVFDKPKVTA